jgi:hypothetical protein
MRGRPGKRSTKSAKKSTRTKTARAKTGRAGARKAAKAPAKKKAARKAAAPGRKKSAAKKTKAVKKTTKRTARPSRKEVFGGGNYTASREFRNEETDFARRDQGTELEEAEEEAGAHSHSPGDEH